MNGEEHQNSLCVGTEYTREDKQRILVSNGENPLPHTRKEKDYVYNLELEKKKKGKVCNLEAIQRLQAGPLNLTYF